MNIDGREVAVGLKRSPRAKRMKLRVLGSGHISVTLPSHVSEKEGIEFLQSEREWLIEVFKNVKSAVPFQTGTQIPVLGCPVEIHNDPAARRGVWLEDNRVYVSGQPEHLPRRLTDWFKAQAKQFSQETADAYARRINQSVGRVSIRDQKSRWGSCSAQGNLNFSWRLYMAPEYVFDYVVAHEVCHLTHMNHSPQFWGLLDDLCPNVKAAKKWLKSNAADLHKYGATN